MEKQKKSQKGITLVALVVSIVVMMVLAGVSLNMTIGDNGIINQAQDAKYKMSMAELQEYIQQKYVEHYGTISDGESTKSPLERMIELYSDWFYRSGSNDFVLKEYTYTDEDGEEQSGFLKIRLIVKNNLPREIRDQIAGGDAIGLDGTPNSDYAYDNLKDVYGITGDLKVFYCADGLDSYVGADFASSSETDSFDGTKTIYEAGSNLARVLATSLGSSETQEWSMQDLKGVKELTIPANSGLTNLAALADMPNITKLTLTNYKGSLSGIEKAYKVTSITFNNSDGSQEINYSGLSKVSWLKELYFKNPTNDEVKNLFTEMGKTNYNQLTTLGLYGGSITSYGNASIRSGSFVNSSFTNVMSDGKEHMSLLTDTTKATIVKLYLDSNSISQLDVSKYTSVSSLYLNHNNFTSVPTLKTGNYSYLDMGYNSLTSFSLPSGVNVTGQVHIDNNSLTSLVGLLNHGIVWCRATGNSSLDFSTLTQAQRTALSNIYIELDSAYALAFPTSVTIVPTSTTDTQFRNQIANATVIKTLCISGCTQLQDSTIQYVLGTLSLNKLNADGTALSSLSCLSSSPLNALSIRNTSITDFTPIINKDIGLLRITNVSGIINFYNSQNSTYKTNLKNFFNRISSSSGGSSNIKGFVGENPRHGCGKLCVDSAADLSTLVNTLGFTNFNANYENDATSGTLNISTSQVTNFTIDNGGNLTKIILPTSVTSLDLERCGTTIEIPSKTFSLSCRNSFNATIKLTSTDTSTKTTITSLVIRGQQPHSSWSNIRINNLTLCAYNYDSTDYGKEVTDYHYNNSVTLSALRSSNMTTDIGSINIGNVKYTSLSELNRFTTTTTLRSWCNNLTSLGDFLEKNTVITGLYLTKNSLNCLDGLENGTNLQSLDLSNNALENQYTSKVTGKTVNTSAKIASLPNLTWVNLSGNTYYNDFAALEAAGFTNNGKNVFTRTLGGN